MMQEMDAGTTVDLDGVWTFGADITHGAPTPGAGTIRPMIATGLLIVQLGIGGVFDQAAITMSGQSIFDDGRKVPEKWAFLTL